MSQFQCVLFGLRSYITRQNWSLGRQIRRAPYPEKVFQFDFCLGEYDVVATYSAPDDTTAAALALAVVSAGHLKTFKTTKLLSPEEFLEAQRKASGLNYQAPTQG